MHLMEGTRLSTVSLSKKLTGVDVKDKSGDQVTQVMTTELSARRMVLKPHSTQKGRTGKNG